MGVPMSPTFSAALVSAIDEFMTGKFGRPKTLVEIITWLFNQTVNPNHSIGKAFELAMRDEVEQGNDFFSLLKSPKRLKEELENFLSPGIINFSTSVERIMLGQLPWNQLPVEFMMVWMFGRNRWTVEKATPVRAGNMTRIAFLVRNPNGIPSIFISASGETDKKAEEQGILAHDEFSKAFNEDIPRFIVTISNENEGKFKQSMPGIIRLHYLPNFLINRA